VRRASGAARMVGACYVCQLPVRAVHAVRVPDYGVLTREHLPVGRLVHAGECENTLRTRLGFAP